ncbi:MAG: DUF120 domain-containing protein [Candidatus Methanomethylophilaceae archaeon]|nr:DUF120 domain-containing protein [Candidatus Methanomethylophilaceae archaeon]
MDEKITFALRKIALLGAIDDYVTISSRELGEMLDMSQQSASKRILDLMDNEYILRDLGTRSQRIKLTEKGVEALREEYNEYRRLFELDDHLLIHGTVSSGMGEGGYYICQKGYMDQFQQLLGFTPYEGTLNLTVDKDDLGKIDLLRRPSEYILNGFTSDGRSFGTVYVYKAKIKNMDCAVVIPERSHYRTTLEIVCQYHLRRTLSLTDGSRVDLKVEL